MIPETYKIDFSSKRLNLAQDNLNRLLCQFKDSPVICQIISAYSKQYQELHDATIDLMELRTLYNAKGYYLDALGRILGRNRQIVFESGLNEFADDSFYSDLLLLQTYNNTNKHSSWFEISNFFKTALGFDISIVQSGIMGVMIYTPPGTYDLVELYTSVVAESNYVQGAFITPFPATITIQMLSEFEVLADIGGSGKRCRIQVTTTETDDSGVDIWKIIPTTSNLNATPNTQFKDLNGSNKNCNIQAKFVGVDDYDNDIWNLFLTTTNLNETGNRKFLDMNNVNKKCLIQSGVTGTDDNGADIWSLFLTTI